MSRCSEQGIVFTVRLPLNGGNNCKTFDDIFSVIREYFVAEAARLEGATGLERWPLGVDSLDGSLVELAIQNERDA